MSNFSLPCFSDLGHGCSLYLSSAVHLTCSMGSSYLDFPRHSNFKYFPSQSFLVHSVCMSKQAKLFLFYDLFNQRYIYFFHYYRVSYSVPFSGPFYSPEKSHLHCFNFTLIHFAWTWFLFHSVSLFKGHVFRS